MRKFALLATCAVLLALAPAARAADAFTPAQKAEIESIVKQYLTKDHPEVLAEGLQNLQARAQEDADAKTKEAIVKLKSRIYDDPATPVGGNPKGDVTIVEFFDYQCGYCKMSEPGVEKLLKEDGNIKYIYKDFPILGPESVTAAKASLASAEQGKYVAFHDALMNKPHITDAVIFDTAKSAGLDVAKLKKDMDGKAVKDHIDADLKLGEDVGVRGTPMFIVGDDIYPGALQYDQLKDAVAQARKK